jgi:hypothetical protein
LLLRDTSCAAARLVASLARDLQQNFYPMFGRILNVLLLMLDISDPSTFFLLLSSGL